MKKVISAFAVLAIVTSAFAFKPVIFGQGSTYCDNACAILKNFTPDPNGTITAPCGVDAQNQPLPVYRFVGANCQQFAAGTTFKASLPGK